MSLLSDFTYGGIDGIITTFAIVAGSAGAGLSPITAFVLGMASLLADGFSMGAGRYISAKAELEENIRKNVSPEKSAVITFFSFVILGLLPLSSFIIGYTLRIKRSYMWKLAYALTFLGLFIIGYVKGYVLNKDPVKNAISTLLIGGVASIIAYFVAKKLSS